jgi:hypothetical protein
MQLQSQLSATKDTLNATKSTLDDTRRELNVCRADLAKEKDLTRQLREQISALNAQVCLCGSTCFFRVIASDGGNLGWCQI